MKSEAIDHSKDIDWLYRRYIVMVSGRSLRILGNQALAEEVAQEAFIKYIKRLRKGGQVDNPAGLLYRIATNLALNYLRDSKRRRELQKEAVEGSVDGKHTCPENVLAIRQMLTKVPMDEARLASYYYLDDMDQDEIAKLLSMQRRAVGRKLDRFRDRARRILERQ